MHIEPTIGDYDAYQERYAIIDADEPELGIIELYNRASAGIYDTPWAKVLTAAARDNWEPAKRMCEYECAMRGWDFAEDVMSTIRAIVREKLESNSRWKHGSKAG